MLTLRKANLNDMLQYFYWRNEAIVRKNSFNIQEVSWSEHQAWFVNRLNDENCFLYIGMDKETYIGQVRFDCQNGLAIIDYSIDKDHRRQGLGKEIVEKAIFEIKREYLGLSIIKAEVKTDNVASNKLFVKLNFINQHKKRGVQTYLLKLS